MRYYWAINVRDSIEDGWTWTGTTRDTRAEASQTAKQLRDMYPKAEYQVERIRDGD